MLTILEAIEKIKIYSRNLANSELLFEAENQMPYNAICDLLLAIGEESKKIEPGLKETQGFIWWDEISGLRNRIAHDYRLRAGYRLPGCFYGAGYFKKCLCKVITAIKLIAR